jgi:succinate-semialdehyde dehydrogenase/glutarate-semialdehyde dehydrogenase
VARHPARERAAILRAWHAAIVAHTDDLAKLMSLEQGKPLAEARGEVAYGASYVLWFAEEATRTYGDLIPQQQRGKQLSAVKEPVVSRRSRRGISPLAMIARKIAPALAAGCGRREAGRGHAADRARARLPRDGSRRAAGVLNLIAASRSAASTRWPTGWPMPACARSRSPAPRRSASSRARIGGTLKKLSLELGGNAPFIVFDDADLDAAVDGLMAAKFRNGGQTCVAEPRLRAGRRHDPSPQAGRARRRAGAGDRSGRADRPDDQRARGRQDRAPRRRRLERGARADRRQAAVAARPELRATVLADATADMR